VLGLHATILDFEGSNMGFLTGKKLLITGVLSNRSIAYGIAKSCHAQGAELAFSYVGERFKDRITEFAADFDSKLIFDCDVGSDEQITQMFTDLAVDWPTFDGFVHAIGYAPRESIAGDFLEGLSREVSRSPTTSAPIAFRRWPRPRCRC
jgi:enoyl-[acyl-carrier protein] reductase I